MKKCNSCGTLQNDKHRTCINCGEKLEPPMSEEEREKVGKRLYRKMADYYDPFYVSITDKIAAALNAALAVTNIILYNLLPEEELFITVYERDICLLSIFLCIFGALVSIFPRFFWALSKLRLAFTVNNADDAEPSDFYIISSKITVYGGAVFGAIAAVLAILRIIKS